MKIIKNKLEEVKEKEIWVEVQEYEVKEFLHFVKDKGFAWINGESIKPSSDQKGFHFYLKDKVLARISPICWIKDKSDKEVMNFTELKKHI